MVSFQKMALSAFLLCILIFVDTNHAEAQSDTVVLRTQADSIVTRRARRENIPVGVQRKENDMSGVTHLPFLSVQQKLKGAMAGLYVQENTGEPGALQNMVVRGLSYPVFSGRDITQVQPAVYFNGIPLIQNHPFVYDIQQYDINPIGTATNLLAGLDAANIITIEIVKDPLELVKLGPLASNGAVMITTNDGYARGPNVVVNTLMGFAMPPLRVNPTNSAYEKEFRRSFFSKYGITDIEQYLPYYIRDIENENYYGTADWANTYYRFAPQYNLNASIAGGSQSADYLFTAAYSNMPGIADNTGYEKYNISYFINMTPFDNLQMRCMLNGSRSERARNRNFRDRFAEMEYLPVLSQPVSPMGDTYKDYFTNYSDNAIDDNMVNTVNGYLDLSYHAGKLKLDAKMQMDYNSHVRHFFLPSTLMESMNYVSEYSGYNRRIIGEGTANYHFNIGTSNFFNIGWQGSVMTDKHNYNYIRGYDGESDEYKTSKNGNYKLYRYKDHELANLVSTSFVADYRYQKLLQFGVVLRYDGYSNLPPYHRWMFTPAFSASWNLKNQFFSHSWLITDLFADFSAARTGRLTESDRFAQGAQYTSEDLNWSGQSVISSYAGYPSITRSYSGGWIDHNATWPYADKLNVNIGGAFLNNRIHAKVGIYQDMNKNLMIQTAVSQEFGYKYRYLNGMEIVNTGADIQLSGDILVNPKGLDWSASFHANFNHNELKRLPDGDELIIGDRKLKTGYAIDQFWLYENEGIYTDEAQIPSTLNSSGKLFRVGDPVWSDRNNDQEIDEQDKFLKGHAMPKVTGGLFNRFAYGRFDLQFHFYFALGHSTLNTRDSRRYDFMTLDSEKSLDAVKEIFFWQNTRQKDDYPLYNPMSEVHPYRYDQDLFLESLSYLKLRSVTVGYTVPMKKHLYVYLTGTNFLTLSRFSGDDPELIEFNGYYTGYAQPVPKSFLLGIRFKY